MEKIRASDEWLYRYMPIVDEALIKELENNTDYAYPFTNRFERRMKKLMRREAHPWLGAFCRLSKKAAILFVCLLSALLVITMSVQAYRVRFFETVELILKDSVLYSYFAGQNQGSFQCYEPVCIPEGYQETERISVEHWFSVTYANEEGKLITWEQMLVQDGTALVADGEYDEQITKEVSGKQVKISLYTDGYVMAYCEHGKYVYVLTADDLSIDEVCRMFGGIADN